MKLFSVIVILLLSTAMRAQPAPQPEASPAVKPIEICIQLSPFGHIILPKEYWAFMEKNYMDAWVSRIEPLAGGFSVLYSAGLIEPFERSFGKAVSSKTENRAGRSLSYSIFEVEKQKKIVSRFAGANFMADLKHDDDISKFLDIVFRYRGGRKESGCFSAQATRSMRKYFEQRSKMK